MKRLTRLFSISLLSVILAPGTCVFAQDNAADGKVSGDVTLGLQTYFSGRQDSAKFEEYRDIPNGLTGDVNLNYENNSGYHFELQGQNIDREDTHVGISGGQYGKFKWDLGYDKIPHNYAYAAQTLYTGVGTGYLQLDDNLQSALHSAVGPAIPALLNDAESTANYYNLGIVRTRSRAALDIQSLDPLDIKLEVKRDERSGTRPLGMTFGFNSAVEAIQPIHYVTTEYSLTGDYSDKDYYASTNYYASVFQDGYASMRIDNPFSSIDSISAPAVGTLSQAPDNYYQSVSFNGVLKDLPLHSRFTSTVSFGWMRQDDPLLAYTSNTAINPNNGAPFDASTKVGLPMARAATSVDTRLVNFAWTARPLDWLSTKTYYRYYGRDNTSGMVHFPGAAVYDGSWSAEEIHTFPIRYSKHDTGADVDFELCKDTKLGVNYKYERTNRDYREVSAMDDNSFGMYVNNKSLDNLMLRASWTHAARRIDGTYDPTVPFDGEEQIANLPWLVKFDEADRNQDSVNLLATYTPIDEIDITGSFMYAKSIYENSAFGLKNDTQHVYSIDAAYNPSSRFAIHGYYSIEQHQSNQKDRQWNPGAVGNPYTFDTGYDSFSNWTARMTDNVQTVGTGLDVVLVPKTVTFKVGYSLSRSNGDIDFGSFLGVPANDANAFNPAGYGQVDDVTIQSLTPQFIWNIRKNLSMTVGYLWEKFVASDFSKTGYKNVVTNAAGAYNGALLNGTLPYSNYEVNLAFARVDYKF